MGIETFKSHVKENTKDSKSKLDRNMQILKTQSKLHFESNQGSEKVQT